LGGKLISREDKNEYKTRSAAWGNKTHTGEETPELRETCAEQNNRQRIQTQAKENIIKRAYGEINHKTNNELNKRRKYRESK